MVSDETYEICLPVLQNTELDDEDKTDRLEELLRQKTNLAGVALENAILDALWRFKEGGLAGIACQPPIRQTALRRPSPASWRGSPTPLSGSPRLGVSPLAPPGFMPSSFSRSLSSTVSPFGSPRPSPRLGFSTPTIPHSPSLNAYEFASDRTPAPEIYGEHQAENVDWIVGDDAVSIGSSVATTSSLNACAPEFNLQQVDMSPHDMLRSILGPTKSDDEIEASLAANNYNLTSTISSLMDGPNADTASDDARGEAEEIRRVVIGRSLTPSSRPLTPSAPTRPGIICKFFLANGNCLRADCRFSHDTSSIVCKYWMMGTCLAGETCVFSHDPALLASKIRGDGTRTPPSQRSQPMLPQDYTSFPALPGTPDHYFRRAGRTPPPGMRQMRQVSDSFRPRSRPASRQQLKDTVPVAPAIDDTEAFPSLGSAVAKTGKKSHVKRGGLGNKEITQSSSLANIIRMSPSPGPQAHTETRRNGRNGNGLRAGENSAAALAIPSPRHIPWLETGDKVNKAYLKARQEAIKHCGLRNKFLQNAAQAWNRNDARAAKALSLRGQSENELMKKAHRDAAELLYQERNKGNSHCPEIYVDLHSLHADEAVEYLERVLLENSNESRPVYAIIGTGHHSKNGRDKVGKMVRIFLNDWRYTYREFSLPGDRNNMGGIIGIDPRSWDRSLLRDGGVKLEQSPAETSSSADMFSQGVEIGDGKVKLLVRDAHSVASNRVR